MADSGNVIASHGEGWSNATSHHEASQRPGHHQLLRLGLPHLSKLLSSRYHLLTNSAVDELIDLATTPAPHEMPKRFVTRAMRTRE